MGMGVRLGIVVDDFKELPGISARPRDEVPKSIHFDVLGTPFGYIKRCRGSLLVPLDHSRGTPWAPLGHSWGQGSKKCKTTTIFSYLCGLFSGRVHMQSDRACVVQTHI